MSGKGSSKKNVKAAGHGGGKAKRRSGGAKRSNRHRSRSRSRSPAPSRSRSLSPKPKCPGAPKKPASQPKVVQTHVRLEDGSAAEPVMQYRAYRFTGGNPWKIAIWHEGRKEALIVTLPLGAEQATELEWETASVLGYTM